MINITHAYSYYGAHNALRSCIDNKVAFMLSTDNESAISICVKSADTHNDIINEMLRYRLEKVKIIRDS